MYLLSILLFLLSCSSNTKLDDLKRSQTDKRNKKLLEEFKLKDNIAKKFMTPVKEEVKEKAPEKDKIPVPESKYTKIPTRQIPKRVEKKAKVKKVIKKYQKYDDKSSKFWGLYKPIFFPGEEIVLDIFFLGVNAGNIHIKTLNETKIGKKDVYYFRAEIHTAEFYSYIYEVHDFIDSFVDKKSITPVKFSMVQRESKQKVDALQLFDSDTNKVFSLFRRVTSKRDKKRKRERDIPKLYQDPFSTFYFLRGLPLKVGDHYDIPIVNKGETKLFEVDVNKIETINTVLGKKEAIKLVVKSNHKGKTIKGGKMYFWYSADATRVLLKLEAETNIGSLKGILKKYND